MLDQRDLDSRGSQALADDSIEALSILVSGQQRATDSLPRERQHLLSHLCLEHRRVFEHEFDVQNDEQNVDFRARFVLHGAGQVMRVVAVGAVKRATSRLFGTRTPYPRLKNPGST